MTLVLDLMHHGLMKFKKVSLGFLCCCGTLSASDLPTLEQIVKTSDAPMKIKATGKRESIEPHINGKTEGKARYYHENGQLYGVIEWRDGKKEGSHTLYRPDGSVEQYLQYEKGLPNGVAMWMDEKSNVKMYAEYVQGASFGYSKCLNSVNFLDLDKDALDLRVKLVEKCQGFKKQIPKFKPSFDCLLAKTKTEILICKTRRLSSLDNKLNLRYIAAKSLLKEQALNDLKKDQIAWLKERELCSGDDVKCVATSMRKRIDQIQSLIAKSKIVTGSPEDAKKFIDSIKGEYRYSFENSDVANETFEVVDELIISESSKSGAVNFEVLLNFFNGHTCGISGVAVYSSSKELVFIDGEEDECNLRIRKTEDAITLEDSGTCKMYCGVRGSFGGANFPLSAKGAKIKKNRTTPN